MKSSKRWDLLFISVCSFLPYPCEQMCLFNTTAGRDGDPKELKGPFLLLATQAGSYMSGCDIVSLPRPGAAFALELIGRCAER